MHRYESSEERNLDQREESQQRWKTKKKKRNQNSQSTSVICTKKTSACCCCCCWTRTPELEIRKRERERTRMYHTSPAVKTNIKRIRHNSPDQWRTSSDLSSDVRRVSLSPAPTTRYPLDEVPRECQTSWICARKAVAVWYVVRSTGTVR